jgi:RNA recognition motif-containing protein
MTENDFGSRNGRRLECTVCTHSWFQSKDKLLKLNEGFEMVPLPERDLERIQNNMQNGLSPKFMGDFKLYVGNIAFECHEDDLYEVFGRVGEVGEVSLVRDDEGRNRGFGFITMRTKEDGEKAIEELNGTPVRGRNIAVRESNT